MLQACFIIGGVESEEPTMIVVAKTVQEVYKLLGGEVGPIDGLIKFSLAAIQKDPRWIEASKENLSKDNRSQGYKVFEMKYSPPDSLKLRFGPNETAILFKIRQSTESALRAIQKD